MPESIDLGGIAAEVIRKRIKHVHLSVYPPACMASFLNQRWIISFDFITPKNSA